MPSSAAVKAAAALLGKGNHHCPITIRAPPHVDYLVGFPGVPATRPRLIGTVELRGSSLLVSYVSISLHCTTAIYPHSSTSAALPALHSTKREVSKVIGKELLLYTAPEGRPHETVLSMDIPFELALPNTYEDLPTPSIALGRGQSVSTSYTLVATLHQATVAATRVSVPVRIDRYDNLSTWGMFAVPQAETTHGADHIVSMGVSIPRTSAGPGDIMGVFIELRPNPDWPVKTQKVRVDSLTVSIEQLLTYKFSVTGQSDVVRKKKIVREEIELYQQKLPNEGLSRTINLPIPTGEESPSRSSSLKSALSFEKDDKENDAVAIGFTTECELYKIEYNLSVKAKLTRAKDVALKIPIHISPWNRAYCKRQMEGIEMAVREERKRYARSHRGGGGSAFGMPKSASMGQVKIVRPEDDPQSMLLGGKGSPGKRRVLVE
ncbi:hypothetical protein SAICODRAFT_72014 [Saitoella complicata NRRL Y-17804]|uniref:Arrestin C-terminal-like domain-containing protein n=1 Tax=Saitoella complicata (strain BCRC 22490 / CBS 7301 / JCM 7358 / NBRC 10748 / NRRL Y-17804) TaxID=698492 RepID=A0A0E9NHV0_SAICN|nr:uncharacterized protein SAICODRAFT_72014 [Saitoella complicata NRRL Y-17804]ODQ52068.1 hypothetical protein SAICODRAFT_72014 [Saitoella complicata NRRL Y-17804]GAO49442.1 hypothetical protein G7K_3592-t1 [Saitoella complicata NRRL Y-17804]